MVTPRLSPAALLLVALLPLGCGAQPAPPAQGEIPAALQGRWTPVSRALEGPGPLTVAGRRITWAPCGRAAHAVQPQPDTGPGGVVLALGTACRLDEQPVTHLRLRPHAGRACEMEATAYESAAQWAKGEPLAWGVYEQPGCAAR